MGKLVYGVGVNDADYTTSKEIVVDGKRKVVWTCPFYKRWQGMLERCYSKKFHIKNTTYVNCLAAAEWHYFMTFKAWMETQDWEGKHLDKDILLLGNKIYGPDACVFIDQKVNGFLNERQNDRGEWPIGVTFHKRDRKFHAQGYDVMTGKRKSLGYYDDPQEAHSAWLSNKLEQAKILASQQTDKRVAEALIKRYENYK